MWLLALALVGCGDKDDDTAGTSDGGAADGGAADGGSTDGGSTDGGAGDGGSADGGSTDGGATAGVTWEQVQPILVDNCYGCHKDEGIALSLQGHDNASLWSNSIAAAVSDGRMPPWPPSGDCVSLADVRGLAEEEIATLVEWAEAGAPRGDAADVELPGVDKVDADAWVQLAEPYTPDEGLEDDYRCFVVDPGLTEDVYVERMEVFPGNTSIVHHVLLYDDVNGDSVALDEADPGPGYQCYGGPKVENSNALGGWVPGMDEGVVVPEGTGLQLKAGTRLVLQLHYAPQNDPGRPDQTRMALHFAEGEVQPLYLIPFVDYSLGIPAGESHHVEGVSYTNTYLSFQVHGVTPHMHKLGKEIRAGITREGESQCLIEIEDWDFEYQQFYWFEEPFRVEVGDEMWLECVYDNSASNPDNPHSPPQDVQWGDGTSDEMCLLYVMATL